MKNINWNTNYKVKGYTNTWSVIDEFKGYVLLENNFWGDETCYLVARKENNVEPIVKGKIEFLEVQDIVDETFDGLGIALYDLGIIEEVE